MLGILRVLSMTFSDIVNLNYNFSYITETISLPEMLTTYKNYLKERLWVEEMAPWVRCLLLKPEDLGWDPITYTCNLNTGKGTEQEDPRALVRENLRSHSSV